MNIYQQKKLTGYHIQVKLAKYTSEHTFIKLMHGDNEREVYRINGGTSFTQIGTAIPKLSAFWASEYGVPCVDVVIEDTLLGAALVEFLTERLTPEWHPRLPSSDGYYFVTDGKDVNVVKCGPKEPILCTHVKGELYEVASFMPVLDVNRNCVDTSAVTHHTPVPEPSHWHEKAPDADGWYFVQLRHEVKLGYCYSEPYDGEYIKEQRFIKTFDGNIYYPVHCFRHAEVFLPSPP